MLIRSRSIHTTVYYRFQVINPRTQEPYTITLAEDGSPIEIESERQPFDRCFDVAYGESDIPRLVPSALDGMGRQSAIG